MVGDLLAIKCSLLYPLIMEEQWRVIGAAPNYEVSNLGRVRRIDTGLIRAVCIGRRWGYLLVGLTVDGRNKTFKVHRLVCEAFHGPPPRGQNDVAHGDGNRTNAAAGNLRWASRAENVADMFAHGNEKPKRGSTNSNSKLTEADVAAIRAEPRRRGLLYELAARYGISRNVVGNIRTKGSGCWPHVPFPDHDQPPASRAVSNALA